MQRASCWKKQHEGWGSIKKTWVHGIGDGAPWVGHQMDLRFGTQGRCLVDFYHVCEYLAAAATVCAQDSRTWLHQQQERLKTGSTENASPAC